MPNDRQIKANRNNALKSTGPRTAKGKSVVSQNSITHGLLSNQPVIKGESRQDFELFRNRLIGYFKPAGELEQLLTERIVAGFWRQNRAGRIEVEILNAMFEPPERSQAKDGGLPFKFVIRKTYKGLPDQEFESIKPVPKGKPKEDKPQDPKPAELTLGQAISADFSGANILGKFRRYEAHIDRTLYRALHELQRLQATRKSGKQNPPMTIDLDVTGIAEKDE